MAMMLGTLTIGQAPRSDVTPILNRYIAACIPRVHRGLLDGLSRQEIAAKYAAQDGEPVLVTRLADAGSVQLSARKVHAALQGKLEALESEGCSVVLLLCTGAFNGLRLQRAFLLAPDRIIPPVVAGLVGDRRLGIIVPVASQITSESGKWKALDREPLFAAADPYAATLDPVATAGLALAARGAEALLLDCIGFGEEHRRELVHACKLPAILSNALLAKIAAEILSG
jgi:protein AroM